jgi:hypothetical protein
VKRLLRESVFYRKADSMTCKLMSARNLNVADGRSASDNACRALVSGESIWVTSTAIINYSNTRCQLYVSCKIPNCPCMWSTTEEKGKRMNDDEVVYVCVLKKQTRERVRTWGYEGNMPNLNKAAWRNAMQMVGCIGDVVAVCACAKLAQDRGQRVTVSAVRGCGCGFVVAVMKKDA